MFLSFITAYSWSPNVINETIPRFCWVELAAFKDWFFNSHIAQSRSMYKFWAHLCNLFSRNIPQATLLDIYMGFFPQYKYYIVRFLNILASIQYKHTVIINTQKGCRHSSLVLQYNDLYLLMKKSIIYIFQKVKLVILALFIFCWSLFPLLFSLFKYWNALIIIVFFLFLPLSKEKADLGYT